MKDEAEMPIHHPHSSLIPHPSSLTYGLGVGVGDAGGGGISAGLKRGSISSRIATTYKAPAMAVADDFTSASIMRSYVSRLVCQVTLKYSIGSCETPIPGKPAALNDVLSVPPGLRPREFKAPATPRSLNGARASRSTFAASGGPKILIPRAFPVPLSMLK